MNNKNNSLGWVIVVLVLIVVIGAIVFFNGGIAPTAGNSSATFPARVATSSTIQAGPQLNQTLFAQNTSCAARIISTVASPVMLSFGITVPTALNGHLQAASTTVAYPGNQYGCGPITAYGFASSTITLTETNR